MRILAFFIVLFFTVTGVCYSALETDGMTFNSSKDVIFWINSPSSSNPNPRVLINAINTILEDEEFLKNPSSFPIGWFFVVALQKAKYKMSYLKAKLKYLRGAKYKYLDFVIRESENYVPVEITDYSWSIDFLWAEFLATAEKRPVYDIITALSWQIDEDKIKKFVKDGGKHSIEVERFLTQEAAMWSLAVNAKEYTCVKQACDDMLSESPDKVLRNRLTMVLETENPANFKEYIEWKLEQWRKEVNSLN